MAEPVPPHWQLQEAKQRFSEVIRAVEREGPQIITRHGEDVAVIINIAEWHKLATPRADLKELLLGSPPFDDDSIAILDEVEAERKHDFGPGIDLTESP